MPEHDSITDPNIHEPTGAASATAGEVYVSDGAGSGLWLPTGGTIHAEMEVVNNTTGQSLTAATDSTLNTNSDYVQLDTGIWTAGLVSDATFDTSGYISIATSGIYIISGWFSFQASVVSTYCAIKYSTDNTTSSLSTRKLSRLSGASGDIGNMAATGIVQLSVGDKVSIFIAVDKNATITTRDAGLAVILLKAT
jgi:hypothetical protein